MRLSGWRARATREAGVGLQLRANEAIVERLPDPLLILAADRSVRRSNAAARAAFGTDMPAVLRHPGLRGAIDLALETGLPQTAELSLPVPVPREVHATVIVMDAPKAEAGSGQVLVVLSDRSRDRAVERMRADFVANASHELRTPLTTIRGFAAHYRQRGGAIRGRSGVSAGAGLGADNQVRSFGTDPFVPAAPASSSYGGPTDGMSSEDLDHLMSRVESEATRMGLLVEDLLTLARLDQQRPLNFALVDLLTLAVDAVQDARIVSPGRQIDLVVAPGTAFLVDGDEPRLRQVLSNLVNNALTHTPAATPVRVKIGSGTLPPPGGNAAGQWAPAVVLDVEDDGPGMTAEQAQRVFERFYRADAARNRASGGSGLGLAIVAGLVTAHGGTVSVRTAPGQGADFEVRLPLSPDAVAPDDPDDRL